MGCGKFASIWIVVSGLLMIFSAVALPGASGDDPLAAYLIPGGLLIAVCGFVMWLSLKRREQKKKEAYQEEMAALVAKEAADRDLGQSN